MARVWTSAFFVMMAISAAMALMASADEMMCNYLKEQNSETMVTEFIMDCQRLQLGEVPVFNSKRKVDKLLLGGNQITRVLDDAFKHISPSVIDLHGNIITTMEDNAFRGLETKLKSLNLSVNPLPFYKLESAFKLSELEILDLHDTNLREKLTLKKAAFRGLDKLRHLVLGGNGIRTLNRTFSGLNELRILDLQNNKLSSLGHSLGGLKKLEKLDISSNNLRHFPKDDLKDLENLVDLSLHGNRIKKIQDGAFDKANKIERLCLSQNPIKTFELLNAPAFKPIGNSLKHLDLKKTNLPSAPVNLFKETRSLESLDISSNKFKDIPNGAFSSLNSLKVLKLGSNPLTLNPGLVTGLENSIKEIYLDDMDLTKIPSAVVQKLQNLEKLDLSSNDITEITAECLAGIGTWKYSFEKNKIEQISPQAFESAKKPVEVDLVDNKLRDLDFAANGCRFAFIDVTDNPITCGCSVRELLRHADLEIIGTCTSPAEYRNLDIMSPEFREETDAKCNRTKTEIVYCNLAGSDGATGGAVGESRTTPLYLSLLISVLIQTIGVLLHEL
ncbi:leucine-rich repeat-containing G-protein coupled receptor 4-like [Liolophura sinensis]|uniref:leucine-rich repeat-containing G-protein coupled receptor 4-like n=1 Tax=Liolophura sinensis TaxID=3198878 RepID=UPI003158A641